MTTHTIIAHRLLALGFDNNKVGTVLPLNFLAGCMGST